ncbi:hypothetical protein P280DRAFT_535344 [Massarina eburnea CBS 473.64]|uniref:Uncharacterized protein n=1 Tax=Massarina eburnea CBS 473.64 TaxID=1395130 RepID=A0A6A6SA37_9PLEO|nr:hypothetical protein P280DRAFT_535344 [Massarina eburnea CBS 473.64]
MTSRSPVSKDPYALAYRYRELMKEKPKRVGERNNTYYENLLANQPDPADDDMDARSRAIRYAKEHYECFYEYKHLNVIVEYLDKKAAKGA